MQKSKQAGTHDEADKSLPESAKSAKSGEREPGPLTQLAAPVLVISPHLDDAVFSCADLLAAHPGSLVGTVCTGLPPEPADTRGCTPWDRACGFSDARQAMQARHAEDQQALGLLGARALPIGFLDRQYGASPHVNALAAAIENLLEHHSCKSVLMPLGLCHPDHDLVHRACLQVLKCRPLLGWLAYEEAPYRRFDGLVQRRLVKLAQDEWIATPVSFTTATSAALTAEGMALRREAVKRYASQLRGFDATDIAEFFALGRYWRLSYARANKPAAAAAG
jgi:LmbE family N-acetylglucosaminyl deacetylase